MNNIQTKIKNMLNLENDWKEKSAEKSSRVNNMLTQLYGENTDEPDVGANENESKTKPVGSINLFMKKDGSLVNPYMDYQKILDGNTASSVTKNFITQATGLTPTAKQDTYNQNVKNQQSNTANTISDKGFYFNSDADENSLANLDVATELPKLSVNQISEIISRYFSKSTVISPSDAEGIFKAQQDTGMSALAILGIGALESGYGTSNIAKQKNNIWGWNATNTNPGGNATSFSQMSDGASQFANAFMKTYYNGYGAHSIYSAGTGNNPSGKGYAYNDDGTINTSWATNIGSIMKNFYQTAKSVQPQSSGTTSSSNALVQKASQYLGTPYVYGGTTPKGFDCSGLMQYVYKANGISIPRTSQEQFKSGQAIDRNDLQPGDLVFFVGSEGSQNNPGHVGMYIGNGQYIQAPKTGDVVKISNLSGRKDYVGARRYV